MKIAPGIFGSFGADKHPSEPYHDIYAPSGRSHAHVHALNSVDSPGRGYAEGSEEAMAGKESQERIVNGGGINVTRDFRVEHGE
jgi:hypothetical protein